MWKCKECGGTDFKLGISGYVDAYFDKDGMCEICEMTLETIEEECVECCKCENNGNYIQDIADWEEEDERD